MPTEAERLVADLEGIIRWCEHKGEEYNDAKCLARELRRFYCRQAAYVQSRVVSVKADNHELCIDFEVGYGDDASSQKLVYDFNTQRWQGASGADACDQMGKGADYIAGLLDGVRACHAYLDRTARDREQADREMDANLQRWRDDAELRARRAYQVGRKPAMIKWKKASKSAAATNPPACIAKVGALREVQFDLSDDGPCYVYFLVDGDEVVYVGQSTNIMGRVASHEANPDKVFDRVFYIEVDRSSLGHVERKYIRELKPKYNISCLPRPKTKAVCTG